MKHYFYFTDDHIWFLRDIAKSNYASLFDSPYLGFYRDMYQKYGHKVQINCFYQTDESYNDEYFDMSMMPDKYKNEWIANAHWLRLAFHARKEFPDYPYINADYDVVAADLKLIKNEIIRFAGEETFSNDTVIHWGPMSKDGCRALKDGGIRMINLSSGAYLPRDNEEDQLSEDHKARLRQNRKPETRCVYSLELKCGAPVGNNHREDIDGKLSCGDFITVPDSESGLMFLHMWDITLNNFTPEENAASTRALADRDFVGFGTHEQYFWPFYKNYRADYKERMEAAIRVAAELGAKPVFVNEMPE